MPTCNGRDQNSWIAPHISEHFWISTVTKLVIVLHAWWGERTSIVMVKTMSTGSTQATSTRNIVTYGRYHWHHSRNFWGVEPSYRYSFLVRFGVSCWLNLVLHSGEGSLLSVFLKSWYKDIVDVIFSIAYWVYIGIGFQLLLYLVRSETWII